MKKLWKVLAILCVFLMAGCGSNSSDNSTGSSNNVDLTKLSEKIKETVEWPMMQEADESTLNSMFYLSPDMYEEANVQYALVNVSAAECMLVKAKEGKLEDVKQALQKRLDDLDRNWGMYLPEQHDLVKAAKTYENNGYYFIVIHEEAEKVISEIEKAFK